MVLVASSLPSAPDPARSERLVPMASNSSMKMMHCGGTFVSELLVSLSLTHRVYSDEKGANREIRAWHLVKENGY
jgi:hypothetical protein